MSYADHKLEKDINMNSFIKQIESNIPAQSVMHPQSHQRLHSTTYWHVHLSKVTAVFVGTRF